MKIIFILPRISPIPIGGYKMVYEYANRLIKDNFDVSIFYDNSEVMMKYKLPEFIKRKIINVRTQKSPIWFNLNPKVERKSSRNKNLKNFYSSADIVIATGAGTVKIAKQFKKARKFYFIQDFEADENKKNWNTSEKQIYKTYNEGFKKITISKWLKNIIDKHSIEPAIYIRNPLDINVYKIINPISKRDRNIIGMLYHEKPRKGCKYTFSAIKKVKKNFQSLRLIMFGACPPPSDLPNWVHYYQNASQKQTVDIYNKISIFASGPIKEGFGLTGLEAMACGATLISSDNLGAREYAKNGYNCLLSSVKDVDNMQRNIEKLLLNDQERQNLAKAGVKTAKNYSWDKAYSEFKSTLLTK